MQILSPSLEQEIGFLQLATAVLRKTLGLLILLSVNNLQLLRNKCVWYIVKYNICKIAIILFYFLLSPLPLLLKNQPKCNQFISVLAKKSTKCKAASQCFIKWVFFLFLFSSGVCETVSHGAYNSFKLAMYLKVALNSDPSSLCPPNARLKHTTNHTHGDRKILC